MSYSETTPQKPRTRLEKSLVSCVCYLWCANMMNSDASKHKLAENRGSHPPLVSERQRQRSVISLLFLWPFIFSGQLCDSMDCSPSGSSVDGILQAKILEWVAISACRGSSWPRDWSCISCISCIGRQILYHWATWEAPRSIWKWKSLSYVWLFATAWTIQSMNFSRPEYWSG